MNNQHWDFGPDDEEEDDFDFDFEEDDVESDEEDSDWYASSNAFARTGFGRFSRF